MIEQFIKKNIKLIEEKKYQDVLKEIKNFSDNKNPLILYYLAFTQNKLSKNKEALENLKSIIIKNPNFFEAQILSANINEDLGNYDISKSILETIIKKDPNNWKSNYNLGRLNQIHLNNQSKALNFYQIALKINPNNNNIWNAVGNIQKKLNYFKEALTTFSEIVKKFPENHNNYIQLADMQLATGLVDMAENTIDKAMNLKKDNQKAMNILGACYLKQSRLIDAENIFSKIINFNFINNDEDLAYRNLLMTKTYREDYNHADLSKILNEYISKFGNSKKKMGSRLNIDKKKIKIGFVSADFRTHSINNVIHSLFINKNKNKFEFHCYYSNSYEDKVTKWYKKHSDSWTNIQILSDKDTSNLIISKNIDILIFLGGYTENNRFLLGTYRSAPKQVSFHPITSSNIESLDYWITDSFLNPSHLKENMSEKLIRIKSLFNFSKPKDNLLPKIQKQPMESNNYVSFSSFNNPSKISIDSLNLWKEVLNEFKNSKLYLKYYNFLNNKKIQDKILNFFLKEKIGNERIIFIKDEDKKHFFEHYNNIDIALDTYPYSGATTSFGALCMGVPVFTLTGKNYISRQSASVLSSIGLSNWIENNKKDYVKTLKKIADVNNLIKLRQTLRKKIIKSNLCNDKFFYKDFENSIEKILNE